MLPRAQSDRFRRSSLRHPKPGLPPKADVSSKQPRSGERLQPTLPGVDVHEKECKPRRGERKCPPPRECFPQIYFPDCDEQPLPTQWKAETGIMRAVVRARFKRNAPRRIELSPYCVRIYV